MGEFGGRSECTWWGKKRRIKMEKILGRPKVSFYSHLFCCVRTILNFLQLGNVLKKKRQQSKLRTKSAE